MKTQPVSVVNQLEEAVAFQMIQASTTDLAIKAALATDFLQSARAPRERLRKGQTIRIQDDVQRIVTGLTTLNKAGDVTQAQVDAADRWYRDYVMGVVGARDPDNKGSGQAPDIHASMLARSDAVARCRLVRDSLGFCSEARLKLLLIDELSFSAIASKLLPSDVNGRKKIAAQMVLLLEQLAEIYDRVDREKRKSRKG